MNENSEEINHVMFTRVPATESTPEQTITSFYANYKAAHDAGSEAIVKNPDTECDIYQIRARLRGKIEVISKEFNAPKPQQ